MKRIQAAASRFLTKSKEAALSPEASAAIVQILKIASTINVPFCQTACTTVIAFIQMGEAASTNDRQWKMLLDVIKIYACRIAEFVTAISEGQPSDYFTFSDDLRAKIARDAVKDFETNISCTKTKIEERLANGKIKKRVAATAIQEDIVECRQMIDIAHRQFNDRVLNILAIGHAGAIPPKPSALEETEYEIPGARPLRGQDLENLEDVEFATVVQDSFWTNIVRVEVQSKVRIAKIYNPSEGGKEKFEKDIQFLARHWSSRMIHIVGYSSRPQFPFVVFTAASVLPIAERWPYCWELDELEFQSLSAQTELVTKYFFKFVDRRDVNELLKLYMALRDSAVDHNGKVIVAPLTHDSTWETRLELDGDIFIYPDEDRSKLTETASSTELALHPCRDHCAFSACRPFWNQDQAIQTFSIGNKGFATLYQRWPYVSGRTRWGPAFPAVTVGDVVVWRPFYLFKVVANVNGFTGPVRFYPPGKPTSQMHVYRYEGFKNCESKFSPKKRLCISWLCDVDSSQIELDALHRFMTALPSWGHSSTQDHGHAAEGGGDDDDEREEEEEEEERDNNDNDNSDVDDNDVDDNDGNDKEEEDQEVEDDYHDKKLEEHHDDHKGYPSYDYLYGSDVPTIYWQHAFVTTVQYFVELEERVNPSPQIPLDRLPYLYMYFSPQNEYITSRWSFHPEPPTEDEASEEASLLDSYPKISSQPKCWLTEYLLFEDIYGEPIRHH